MKKIIMLFVVIILISSMVTKAYDRHAIVDSIISNPIIIKNYLYKENRDWDYIQNIITEKMNLFKIYFKDGYIIVKDEEFFNELPEQCRGSAITITNKSKDTTIALIFDYNDLAPFLNTI
jgi:hypothetical protein